MQVTLQRLWCSSGRATWWEVVPWEAGRRLGRTCGVDGGGDATISIVDQEGVVVVQTRHQLDARGGHAAGWAVGVDGAGGGTRQTGKPSYLCAEGSYEAAHGCHWVAFASSGCACVEGSIDCGAIDWSATNAAVAQGRTWRHGASPQPL